MRIPDAAPTWLEAVSVFNQVSSDGRSASALAEEWARGPAPDGKYRHWSTVKAIPHPTLSAESVWAVRKMSRQPFYRQLDLVDTEGKPFRYALVDPVLERLHRIDREAAGQIVLPDKTATRGERDRYVTRSLMEEAITSSQLEGAATTRAVAKEMLRSGRAPRDRSEQMVLNNYRAMEYVRDRVREPLTRSFIEGLHRVVTRQLDDADGPYRVVGDGIAVYSDTNDLLHAPPPAEQIPERMERLCTFANETETGVFLHPVLKSILLHFWLAYDHPFTDGNGRTARALFYWSMLREGFWLAEFLSVSAVLKRAPARYAKSFLYTETDENDVTYFMLAQLRAIELAIADLKEHLARRARALREMEALIGPDSPFNHRQRSLLSHALRNADAVYDIASEQQRHGVTYATARADLLALADGGLLVKGKRGRKFIFRVPGDLEARLSQST